MAAPVVDLSRAPDFAAKAGVVLDLYQRWVVGERLGGQTSSSSRPTKTSIQARCEATTGIAPFGRLVEQVMASEPYASAARVFRVVDNGSSHRGQASIDRREGTGARS